MQNSEWIHETESLEDTSAIKVKKRSRHNLEKKSNPNIQRIVKKLFHSASEIENSLFAQDRQDFSLRLAFDHQILETYKLHMSLETEKQRNLRLMKLARGIDYISSVDESDNEELGDRKILSGSALSGFSSVSPLLMQQRYEELSNSYRNCHKFLCSRNALITKLRCDIEELQARYDYLVDEFHDLQKRLQKLCHKYLKLQQRKDHEIELLKEGVSFASECIVSGQVIINHYYAKKVRLKESKLYQNFKQNLSCFKRSLAASNWIFDKK